jgi:Asp/Glu/hydantoin racemase
MTPNRHVAIVHTSFVLVDLLNRLFDEILPGVKRTHIVEHSILQDVMDAGRVTPDVMRRMLGYFALAEATGADVILSACSSVGDTVDVARTFIRTPIVKIDDAMAAEAVQRGARIGVMATVPTTLDPTCRLLERHAATAGSPLQLSRVLCEGAFAALLDGDVARHDRIVTENLLALAAEVDAVVLAQASMARLVNGLPEGAVRIPVLSSPERGVRSLLPMLTAVPA